MNIEELLGELKSLKKEAENTADKLQLLINKLEKENLDEVVLDDKTKKVIEQTVREEIQKQKIHIPWSTDPYPDIQPIIKPFKPNTPFPGIGGGTWCVTDDNGISYTTTPLESRNTDNNPPVYGTSPLNPPPINEHTESAQ